ncbi:hypothetical protein EJB05_22762, partial [Eragrostis curvula]
MPPAAAGEPSQSASSIVADTSRGYHILRIDNYSLTKAIPTGEFLRSRPFTVGRHRWFIKYYPNGYSSKVASYVSFFLILDRSVADSVVEVIAQYDLNFVDEVEEHLTLGEVCSFKSQLGWGFKAFVTRDELEESKNLKGDSFAVRCDIVVVNQFRAEDVEEEAVNSPVLVSVPPSNLHHYLGDLLLTEKGADVVFLVGAETFAAHRCVLAIRSPVFRAELFGTMKEGVTCTGVVRIDDMEPQVFKALLHFVYTDSLPEANEAEEEDVMSQHLIVAADRYNLERLKLICEQKLCRYIDLGTVATILTLAEQHQCHGLKKACLRFLRSSANLKPVIATDGFDHLSKSCPFVMMELLAILHSY